MEFSPVKGTRVIDVKGTETNVDSLTYLTLREEKESEHCLTWIEETIVIEIE